MQGLIREVRLLQEHRAEEEQAFGLGHQRKDFLFLLSREDGPSQDIVNFCQWIKEGYLFSLLFGC